MADARHGSTESEKPNSQVYPNYSFKTRSIHWILARMGLFQIIVMFMWLSERAKHEKNPPFPVWIIYTHAAINLIGSTGLCARFLARPCLFAMACTHIHLAYLFASTEALDYSRWLRGRSALHSLASAGIYFRMLGIHRSQSASNLSTSRSYALGVALMSVVNAVLGFVCLPWNLVQIDRHAQVLEAKSVWSFLSSFEPIFTIIFAFVLILSSLAYASPLLLSSSVLPNSSVQSVDHFFVQFIRLADLLTAVCVVLLALLRDCNMVYWRSVGSDTWLQWRLLLDCAIVLLGLCVTVDLSVWSTSKHVPSPEDMHKNKKNE